MENLKIKHFNGLESEWDARINASAFNNDLVFAKVWKQDPSTSGWSKKLIIYAGKDQFTQEYSYVIPDFDTFIMLEKRVNILEGKFTDSSFKEALENYINDSSKIASIDRQIDLMNTSILGLDSSIQDINASIGDINLELIGINEQIVDIDTSIKNLVDDVNSLNTSMSAVEEAVRWVID